MVWCNIIQCIFMSSHGSKKNSIREDWERGYCIQGYFWKLCFDFWALLDLQTLAPHFVIRSDTVKHDTLSNQHSSEKNVLNSPRRKGENKMGVNISLYTVFIFSQPGFCFNSPHNCTRHYLKNKMYQFNHLDNYEFDYNFDGFLMR